MSIRKIFIITAIVFHVGIILSTLDQPETFIQCSYNNSGICLIK